MIWDDTTIFEASHSPITCIDVMWKVVSSSFHWIFFFLKGNICIVYSIILYLSLRVDGWKYTWKCRSIVPHLKWIMEHYYLNQLKKKKQFRATVVCVLIIAMTVITTAQDSLAFMKALSSKLSYYMPVWIKSVLALWAVLAENPSKTDVKEPHMPQLRQSGNFQQVLSALNVVILSRPGNPI